MPLAIDPYDSKQFGLSALALSNDLHPAADAGSELDAVLLEGHTPLIAQGLPVHARCRYTASRLRIAPRCTQRSTNPTPWIRRRPS